MIEEIPYSKLDTAQMFARYNAEAAARGIPPMIQPPQERVEMAKALALLMAQSRPKTPPPPPPTARGKRNAKVRAVVIEELCRVEFYEKAQTGERVEPEDALRHNRHILISNGFAYSVVLKRVKARLPKRTKMKSENLRVHATNIRAKKAGYEGAKLPDRRPHSTKGVTRG